MKNLKNGGDTWLNDGGKDGTGGTGGCGCGG